MPGKQERWTASQTRKKPNAKSQQNKSTREESCCWPIHPIPNAILNASQFWFDLVIKEIL